MSKIGQVKLPTITVSFQGKSYVLVDVKALEQIINSIAMQLDLISSGSIAGAWNALPQSPTTGTGVTTNPTGSVPGLTYKVGDQIANSNPQVLTGTGGKRYVTTGWICVQAGNLGTAHPPVFYPLNTPIDP